MSLVLRYEAGSLNNNNEGLLSARRTLIESELESHQAVYEHFSRSDTAAKAIGLHVSAAVAFGVLVSRRSSIELATSFLGRLYDGVELAAGDPRLAMRGWLVNARGLSNIVVLSALIRAWNAYADGQSLKHIKAWYRGTAYPTINMVNV